MDYVKILDKIFWKEGKLINAHSRNSKINKHPNIKHYLETIYAYIDNIKEALYRIHYNIEERPVCKCCNNPVKFIGRQNIMYQTYCSNKCAAKYEDRGKKWYENQKKINIEKYGIECNFYTPNVDVIYSRKKIKESCKQKYGVESNLAIQNINRGKYFCNPDFIEKSKETCLEKYGVDNFAKTKEFKELIKEKKKQIQEKSKKTCLQKYGVDNYIKTKEFKEKSYATKKKNHTFNTSKPEEELYLYIKEKFPLVKRQYKDSIRYPWYCDFYIPELDLFLELNANWTHGKHSFSSTNTNDLYIIECWKKKVEEGHSYYSNAIKTWTIYDVKKRNKAKEENLYYKEVWTLEEAKKFIDMIYIEYGH